MSKWTDLLIRDSLGDDGTMPSTGDPCQSPDIICTQQNTYNNPTQQFGTPAAYAADPNQTTIPQQNNFFYGRAENLGSQTSGGTLYMFWSPSSLLLTPALWKGNSLYSSQQGTNVPYNILPPVGQNVVSVTQTPFFWVTPNPLPGVHFCMIAAVSTQNTPWSISSIPDFPNWDSFIMWLRSNGNICQRNLTLISNPNPPEWDRVDAFYNSFNQDTPLLVSATCLNVPVGTSVTLQCPALGILTTQQVTSANQTIYTQGVTCPAGFDGYIETIAQLPSGTVWGPGALITTKTYFGTSSLRPVAALAHDFGEDDQHPNVIQAKTLTGSPQGELVEVGSCTTAYQPSI